ncbi:MAG: ATP-binding protein, partial [Sphingopyxis sp.]
SLRRALRNLIDNAITYGGSAQLGLERTADGGAMMRVDDDGPGIPAHLIPDMLEPFARAEQSRNRDTGGSGLGLALAKAIALGEGASLHLVNRVGGGLSAQILFPPETPG